MKKQTLAEMKKRFIELGGQFEGYEWIVWKFVTQNFKSPNRPLIALTYPVGRIITDRKRANFDPAHHCGAGLNVHAEQPNINTLINNKHLILIECRVAAKDVACIPIAARKWHRTWDNHYTEGPKFRVKRLKVVATYRYSSKKKDKLALIELAPGYELIPPEKKSKGS